MGFTFWMWFASIILLAAAALMFYQGRKMSRFYREFDRIAVRAEGVVVEINWLSSEAERRSHHIHRGTAYPVVEFSLPSGQIIRAQTHTGRSPAPAKVGEQVTVLYDPNQPEYLELLKNSGRDMMAPLYYVLAIGFVGFACFAIVLWFLLKVVMGIPI